MRVIGADNGSLIRQLAVLCAAVMMLSLVPLTGVASAQATDDLSDACPVEPPEAEFDDREDIPDVHVRNVDCAAFFAIVVGFEDDTYRPRLPVRRDQMATFIANGLDAAEVALPAGTQDQFTDVTSGPHQANVNRLAEAGIVLGGPQDLPDDEYGPALRTRRDQMASFLMRAAGYALFDDPDHFEGENDAPGDQEFDDVPPGNVHYGNVNAAAVHRLAQGFGNDLYGPRQATTRDQMAAFVVRLLNFLAVPTSVEITDLDPGETATVSETITATATVFDQYGNPAAETTTVTFTAETTTPPTETETVVTDEDSEAAFSFTSVVPETVTVTAAIGAPGGNFIADGDSDTADVAFVADPPGPAAGRSAAAAPLGR